MPRIYRVLGTDKDGFPVDVTRYSAESAQREVEVANRCAQQRGWPQDWRAEYADIEWKPLVDSINDQHEGPDHGGK
ncbi:hypothetical protein [Nocardia wallacei]|uniref:hypothetical protein n=1 Tax=Nocardia wallacei TaxID=480035 RepID=UPI002457FAD4|nr:hypothetical protein [Nocardia wallacei]